MKFAVIGDIHGNKYALESVLASIAKKDVDFIVSTGDLVGYMNYPNEVINLMKQHKVMAVQGNHDEAIAKAEKVTDEMISAMSEEQIHKGASAAFTNWCITDENRKYLKHLTSRINLVCGEKKIIIVHGSPAKINEYLYDDKAHLEEVAKGLEEDVIICGHTHIPYVTEVGGKHFINAGSVGKPKHGDGQSCYVIVEIEAGNVHGTIEKVAYPIEEMVRAIKENPMISDSLIPLLETGK